MVELAGVHRNTLALPMTTRKKLHLKWGTTSNSWLVNTENTSNLIVFFFTQLLHVNYVHQRTRF